ncbi:hypothetical protein AB6B38_03065 [Glycocaulis abyssi]|uniref:Uncharacterized protein n=1 Tax=Glycocaulis abyssi TaxID=1433403 RepID=A0ABV9NG31_9PROT
MTFFEPDVLVEAAPGLAESIGYEEFGADRHQSQLIHLDEFFTKEVEHRPELSFGLSVTDAYRDIYESQRRFVLRDQSPSLIFNETSHSSIVEAMFGAFPKEEGAQGFQCIYEEVFEPVAVDVGPQHWFEVFERGATVPFSPTNHKIELAPRGYGDLSFFIFDHTKPVDLIDYWNKRLFASPVYPVPLCWLDELAEALVEMIRRNHRPIPNNPSGMKFHSELYFGRSIKKDGIAALVNKHFSACPNGSFYIGEVRHPKVPTEPFGPTCERHGFTAGSATIDAAVTDGGEVRFDTLDPPFASRYGGGRHRWVNVINLNCHGSDALALTLPTNLEDRSKPRLTLGSLGRTMVTREGWVLGLEHKDLPAWMVLQDGTQAISEWLARRGLRAELSSAGRIARQMIGRLGGLWATHLIADENTLQLLNKMAMKEVSKGTGDDVVKHQFEGRTASFEDWQKLIAQRGKDRLPSVSLEEFTKRRVIKLGLSTKCPHCDHGNWYGLDDVNYEVHCERCLKQFDFPQGETSRNWRYRVIGPFSVPNYAEGSYCVALTLNMFKQKLFPSSDMEMTYSAALKLFSENRNFPREIDFAFWIGDEALFRQREEPRFVFGESKSFAQITLDDVEGLKLVASKLPGSVVVVSMLKDTLSEKEKCLLIELTRWGWESVKGKMRAQVVIVTGRELFADFSVGLAWKKAGAPFDQFDDFHTFRNLDEFARATQKVYLGLDYYAEQKAHKAAG